MNPETTETRYVAYYRVSTERQGNSGLGLEAQRSAVRAFVKAAPIIAEFTEVESGKHNDRKELALAMAAAKESGACLVIAKLDRLSRNARFTLELKESGLEFVCCDMPGANKLTIGIMAMINQDEAERISARTKAALQALKDRGVTLGTPANLTAAARAKGTAARIESARTSKVNRQAAAIATDKRAQGFTLRAIAADLNALDYRTTSGKPFQAVTVKRLLDRAALA